VLYPLKRIIQPSQPLCCRIGFLQHVLMLVFELLTTH